MNYSALIKSMREQLLLTQMELATELGVSFATVNRWEKGHNEPSMKQKRIIRDYCKEKKVGFKLRGPEKERL